MGTIEKRGKNSWRIVCRIQTPAGQRIYRETLRMDPALSEAVQRAQAQREMDILEGRVRSDPTRQHTVRSWAAEWLDRHLPMDCSPVTIANYRQLLESRILPVLGDIPLADLTPARLTDWLIDLRRSPRRSTRKAEADLSRPRRQGEKLVPPSRQQQPLSTKTVIHYYACLNTLLGAAVRLGYLEHNPMERVQRPRQHRQHADYLSENDAIRLIAALRDEPNHCYRLAVLLALSCGLRLGEVCGLRYEDYDHDARTVTVRQALKYTSQTGAYIDTPKTAAGSRTIILPASMVEVIDASWQESVTQLSRLGPDGDVEWADPVYMIHRSDGSPVNKDTPSKWFRRFAAAHGFPGITFHDLRHAHASILIAQNLDVAAVAARMGHSDPSVTLSTYTHAFQARDFDAADVLDGVIAQVIHPEAPPPPADPPDDPDPDAGEPLQPPE